MTTDAPSWEPPLTGTDAEQVLGALDRQRATFRWKADALDAAGLATRVGRSELTLAGLLNHLAFVEDLYSTLRLSGDGLDEQWREVMTKDGWPQHFHPESAPADLYRTYDATVTRARSRFAEAAGRAGGLDQPVSMADQEGRSANLRRLLLDLMEEYGRHTGQADLLREAVDGRVGEDPPDDWATPWG